MGDLFDHRGFVDLIRDLVNDNRETVFADFFNGRFRSSHNGTAPFGVCFTRPRVAKNYPTSRKVWGRDVFHQLDRIEVRLFDQRLCRINYFAKIMRGNVCRHTDSNTTSAIDQHVRIARRQNRRFLIFTIIVILEINSVFFDVSQQRIRRLGHPHLGIAHGCGFITVHGSKVTLPVEQWQRHRKILCHTYQGVINRAVAMRVVFTHRVTNGTRGFSVRFVERVAGFVHRVQNAAVHRLKAIAQIGNRAGNNHAHRVVEVRGFHLVYDGDTRPTVNVAITRLFAVVFGALCVVGHNRAISAKTPISCVSEHNR